MSIRLVHQAGCFVALLTACSAATDEKHAEVGAPIAADVSGNGRPEFIMRNVFTGEMVAYPLRNPSDYAKDIPRSDWAGTLQRVIDVNRPLPMPSVGPEWGLVGSFKKDNASFLLWRDNQGGTNGLWVMDHVNDGEAPRFAYAVTTAAVGAGTWAAVGFGDFDGDRNVDILWRDAASGVLGIWYMNAVPSKAQVDAGATWTRRDALTVPGTGNSWVVAGTGDLDRDGICDIVWFEKAPANPTSAKAAGVWFVKPAVQGNLIRETAVLTSFGVNSYQGQYGASALIADFNSDDIPDILWQGDVGSGTSGIMWYMNHDRSIRDIRWIVTDPVAPNENNPVARSGPWYAGHASGVWQVARQDLSYANMNTGPASIFPVVGQVCQLGVERILGDTWYACVLPN